MSPSAHARLSPSSSERWISCPASVQLEATLPAGWNEDSPYAREGTLAHELGEIEASHHFDLITRAQYLRARRAWRKKFNAEKYEEGTYEEMQAYIKDYVSLIERELARFPGSQLMLEQKMDSGIPESWGTSDAVIFGPNHVQIIDLKYGAGVAVSAVGNTQLRIYGLGALLKYGDILGDTELVIMTIFQPRMEVQVSSDEMSAEDLRKWRDEVAIPAANTALHDPDAPFGPTEKACRWCPFKGTCVARTRAALEEDFGEPFVDEPEQIPVNPALMTPEQLAQVLPRIPAIAAWCKSVEEAALEMAYTKGVKIPGWKPVKSGGKRSITNHEEAVKRLVAAGFEQDEVAHMEPKAKAIGVLEKLVGKDKLPEILGPEILKKGDGKVSLVREENTHKEISLVTEAISDFEEEPDV